MLIVAVFVPGRAFKNRWENIAMLRRIEQQTKFNQFTYTTLSLLFCLLLFLLITVIITRYFFTQRLLTPF